MKDLWLGKGSLAIGGLIVIAALTGCGNQKFFTTINTKYQTLRQLENQYNSDRQANISGSITNGQYDQDLQALIPKVKAAVKGIEDVQPTAPSKFQAALKSLVKSGQDFENALVDIDTGYRNNDNAKLSDASTQTQNANASMSQFESQWKQAGGAISNQT